MEASKANLLIAGDSAILVEWQSNGISEDVYGQVTALYNNLCEAPVEGITEMVPAYASLTVYYDPKAIDLYQLLSILKQRTGSLCGRINREARTVTIPVLYGEEFGPDLEYVAFLTGLSASEVVSLHASRIYTVFMLGFTPGFPYLGTLDPKIVVPRRSTPREAVVAGSVGIAGHQTGIYTISSPGGWHILGRTPLRVFEVEREDPFLLHPGDRVVFQPITRDEFDRVAKSASGS